MTIIINNVSLCNMEQMHELHYHLGVTLRRLDKHCKTIVIIITVIMFMTIIISNVIL